MHRHRWGLLALIQVREGRGRFGHTYACMGQFLPNLQCEVVCMRQSLSDLQCEVVCMGQYLPNLQCEVVCMGQEVTFDLFLILLTQRTRALQRSFSEELMQRVSTTTPQLASVMVSDMA